MTYSKNLVKLKECDNHLKQILDILHSIDRDFISNGLYIGLVGMTNNLIYKLRLSIQLVEKEINNIET